MNVLLDTNIIIFAMYMPDTLSQQAVEWLDDPHHTFMYSVLSLWEVEIKHVKNPKEMPFSAQEIENLCKQCGMKKLELRSEHINTLKMLPLNDKHKDPFDKMLMCQAIAENLVFLTHDSKLSYYGLDCVTYV